MYTLKGPNYLVSAVTVRWEGWRRPMKGWCGVWTGILWVTSSSLAPMTTPREFTTCCSVSHPRSLSIYLPPSVSVSLSLIFVWWGHNENRCRYSLCSPISLGWMMWWRNRTSNSACALAQIHGAALFCVHLLCSKNKVLHFFSLLGDYICQYLVSLSSVKHQVASSNSESDMFLSCQL